MTGVAVRPLAVGDLAVAARLHAALLPHGFFVSLGLRYLRAYYGTFLASPHAIGLVADLEGRPVGVLVGTSANAAHYRWVIRHRGLRLACLGASAMLVRPAVAAWFLRTRLRRYGRRVLLVVLGRARRGGRPALTDTAGSDTAVLTHVMVADQARGGAPARRSSSGSPPPPRPPGHAPPCWSPSLVRTAPPRSTNGLVGSTWRIDAAATGRS